MGRNILNREKLVAMLKPIKLEDEKDTGDEDFEKLGLAGSFLTIAEIDHEKEYALCREVSEHLQGKVPEPEDVDFDD